MYEVPAWKPLFVAYLSGDDSALTPLYKAAKKPMENLVRRIAPSLPEDLREDVVQQLFLRLLENRPKYDPLVCTVAAQVFGLLRNATKHVRSMFTAPGQRTRGNENEAALLRERENEVSDNQDQEGVPGALSLIQKGRESDVEQAVSTRWTAAQATAALLAREVLKMMPGDAARAAWLVYGQGCSKVQVAAITGRSRFSIARDLAVAEDAACRLVATTGREAIGSLTA